MVTVARRKEGIKTARLSNERFAEMFGSNVRFIQIEKSDELLEDCDFCGKKHLKYKIILEGDTKQFGVGRDCCKKHAPEVWNFVAWQLGLKSTATIDEAAKADKNGQSNQYHYVKLDGKIYKEEFKTEGELVSLWNEWLTLRETLLLKDYPYLDSLAMRVARYFKFVPTKLELYLREELPTQLEMWGKLNQN
jgi:hypothetical protein